MCIPVHFSLLHHSLMMMMVEVMIMIMVAACISPVAEGGTYGYLLLHFNGTVNLSFSPFLRSRLFFLSMLLPHLLLSPLPSKGGEATEGQRWCNNYETATVSRSEQEPVNLPR